MTRPTCPFACPIVALTVGRAPWSGAPLIAPAARSAVRLRTTSHAMSDRPATSFVPAIRPRGQRSDIGSEGGLVAVSSAGRGGVTGRVDDQASSVPRASLDLGAEPLPAGVKA